MINKKNDNIATNHHNFELKECKSMLFHMAENNIDNTEEERTFNNENKEVILQEKRKLEAIDKANKVAKKILNLVHNTFTTADAMSGIIEDADGELGSLVFSGASGYISQTGYTFDDNGLTIKLDYSSIENYDNCVYTQSILGSPNSDCIDLEHLKQLLDEYSITFERQLGRILLDNGDSVDLDILTIFVPRTRVSEQQTSSRQ